jgi:hypothetical protein
MLPVSARDDPFVIYVSSQKAHRDEEVIWKRHFFPSAGGLSSPRAVAGSRDDRMKSC